MDGQLSNETGRGPRALLARLWRGYGLLPFRAGIALLTALILLPILFVGALLTLGSGPESRASPHPTTSAPVEAAVPAAPPTWGTYVPPRQVKPSRGRTSRRSAPPVARPRTHPPERPQPTPACPTSLKKWPRVWDVCKHRQPGH